MLQASEPGLDMKELCIVKANQKYLDDEQVKSIWDLAMGLNNDDANANVASCDDLVDEHEWESGKGCSDSEESTENESRLQFESDMYHHYYPMRRSLYNRRQHFTSFIQNYIVYDQGRKIMSDYEEEVCKFIMSEMKPASPTEFLNMMKLCKLSNVYRFHNYIFHLHNKQSQKQVSISVCDIPKIVFVFSQFENFFHRNDRFKRKNFLSMRFILGRILIMLGFVNSFEELDVDLRRPKGKAQYSFHMSIWNRFISENNI